MPKILIADDNTNIQKMVSLAFEERGIDVVSVGNGETAVRKLPDVNPDLVLADVFMPVRNGYEVCEFVKKDTRFAHVPVILLVGAFDPLDEREARRVGADGVLKKPFVPPDPLIAMVMSALERNPKVAAELAKAKEVIREPEPLPQVLENPAQKEPAPLPDFPEPTPEEAAQIYGFGKGVRTLDEAEEGAKDTSPKKPAVEEEEVEEEAVDESTTHRDWHRKRGMDLNIPDEIASQPTFSMDQEFSPISFPSERDVPPRRVKTHDAEPETVAVAKPHLELPLEAKPEVHASSAVESKSEAPAVSSYQAPAVVEAVEIPPVVAPSVLSSEPEVASAPSSAPAIPEPPAPPAIAPPVESPHISAGDQDHTSSASHWMDLMSPAPTSSYGSGSWLDALSPSGEKASAPAAVEASASSPAPIASSEPAVIAAVEEPAIETSPYEAPAAPEADQIERFEPEKAAEGRRTFGGNSDRGGFSYHFSEPEAAPEPEKSSFFAETPAPAAEPEISAPVAVPAAESSFFAREAGPAPEPPVVAAPSNEPVPPAHEFAAETTVAETVSQFFSSSTHDAAERIPTAPPPNREALAGIPFLLPPKEITEPVDATSADANAAPPVDVDTVVQRIVEKLGPQLQEMLAQGLLKPLVENLLQQELAKKEK